MSVWFDKKTKRFRIRIERRGAQVRRILPPGINKAQAQEFHANAMRAFFNQAELGKRADHSIADALNRALKKAQVVSAEKMQGVMGEMGFPTEGGMKGMGQ